MAKTKINTTSTTVTKAKSPEFHSGRGIAWLALIIAIISLGFDIIAYNLNAITTESQQVDFSQKTEESFKKIRLDVAKFKAMSDLAAIEARQRVVKNYTEFESQVSRSRNELQNAFEDAGQTTSAEWQDLNQRFDVALSQIRAGTADSLGTLEGIIEKLRQGIAID
jgi:hypothetical protein